MLEALGLDSALESVYRGLLQYPDAGVDDLCALLGIGEAEVRSSLDRLVDMDLLQSSRECPGMLRAVSPAVGLELILRRQEADLLRRQEELARSKEAVARAVAEFAELRPNTDVDGAERLVGMDAIQSRLEQLARDLDHDCLAIMPGGAQSQASLDASRPLDKEALHRGVQLLTVYQDSARNDPSTLAYARWMSELGGQVRTSPVVPPRMLIFDRTTAVVPINPANTRLGALCTSAPGIVASLVALFEQTWETAVPLGAERRNDSREDTDGLTATERQLLKLLASGMTDEAAGKRLGVSLRTVRRLMAALMERLDATSRFEAGLKAAQKGWL
ncbi:LuxR C-terminal-related transcriptional regulator [Streptomyces sp. HNM0663]|uniref:LuxR C-terminal-related transcriptional regulator n=1 Tax=Streptomyces chengmaiensis TaxID=3040919 RepID=A0ABT6HRT6_9ACTN|nr:LuxR family transcriptional regulator [Streptomyces chengmaiensis]MDH2390963.1 LuxR C-terminal-related transcriptional regulator [Streptomyces chengmaiensis]